MYRAALRQTQMPNHDKPAPLAWRTLGPWSYDLDGFGSITAIFGLRFWACRINGFIIGVDDSLADAQARMENAARTAGYDVAVSE